MADSKDQERVVNVNASFAYNNSDQVVNDERQQGNALVFKGLFNKTIHIALKRYQGNEGTNAREYRRDLKVLSSPENRHPNFIRYFGHAEEKNDKGEIQFSYIAMEWCECSVADIIDLRRKDKANLKTSHYDAILINLTHKEILQQSSEAVCFLHSLGRIHRNIHPDNFLIFCVDPTKDYFLIKLTDFQFSKNFAINPNNTGTRRKDGWVAPESLIKDQVLTNKLDGFLLGCFYFYVLTGGKYPFDKGVDTQRSRIQRKDDPVYDEKKWNGGPDWIATITPINKEEAGWALEMIKGLVKYDPGKRKSVEEALKSKYFLPESYVIYGNPTSPKPGLCVIVTQEIHYNPSDDLDFKMDGTIRREGVGIDARRLESTFKAFGYDILRYRSLRGQEIINLLSPNELVKRTKVPFKDYASLVVCYLGHGARGAVLGVDDVPVSLNQIQYDAFDDKSCPELSGKPKIFIILACQGNRIQMSPVNKTSPSNGASAAKTLGGAGDHSIYDERPPVYDFIRLSSTIEEYMSTMYFGYGSMFIRSLCNALNNEYREANPGNKERNKRDLIQLFTTFVVPSVGRSGGLYRQTPECRSSLSKMIRFRRTETPGNCSLPEYDAAKMDPNTFKIARK